MKKNSGTERGRKQTSTQRKSGCPKKGPCKPNSPPERNASRKRSQKRKSKKNIPLEDTNEKSPKRLGRREHK